jgi:hypothetical protein
MWLFPVDAQPIKDDRDFHRIPARTYQRRKKKGEIK